MIFNKILYGDVTVFDLVSGVWILFILILAAKLAALYLEKFLRQKIERQHTNIIVKITYYTIIVFALILALPMIGVRLSGLLVAGGMVGLAVGFASQNIIGNLISGIFLILEQPIAIGNAVNIDGTVGIVEDIRIMSTTLRNFDGMFVRLPNQKVFTANIINFVSNVVRRFEYSIGIRYTDNADQAMTIIRQCIDEQPFALQNPPPQVFVDELGDNAVQIIVRIWAPVSDWFDLKMVLLWQLKQALESAGIEIAFPQRVVYLTPQQGG